MVTHRSASFSHALSSGLELGASKASMTQEATMRMMMKMSKRGKTTTSPTTRRSGLVPERHQYALCLNAGWSLNVLRGFRRRFLRFGRFFLLSTGTAAEPSRSSGGAVPSLRAELLRLPAYCGVSRVPSWEREWGRGACTWTRVSTPRASLECCRTRSLPSVVTDWMTSPRARASFNLRPPLLAPPARFLGV